MGVYGYSSKDAYTQRTADFVEETNSQTGKSCTVKCRSPVVLNPLRKVQNGSNHQNSAIIIISYRL